MFLKRFYITKTELTPEDIDDLQHPLALRAFMKLLEKRKDELKERVMNQKNKDELIFCISELQDVIYELQSYDTETLG